MATTTRRTDPALWERVKQEVTDAGKGGEPGQWSARKAQLAVAAYKRAGGGYEGRKDPHNSLAEWTKEEWGTKSGARSGDTHERYLPKAARDALSDEDYARTTAAKRRDTRRGQQFSKQPKDIADKTAPYRRGGGEPTKAALLAEARRRGIPGRSRMDKAALAKALA